MNFLEILRELIFDCGQIFKISQKKIFANEVISKILRKSIFANGQIFFFHFFFFDRMEKEILSKQHFL